MTTAAEVVRRIFPQATDEEVEWLLWERTGWPSFFSGPPEQEIERSLTEYREALKLGVPLCDFCCKPAELHDLCMEHHKAMYNIES